MKNYKTEKFFDKAYSKWKGFLVVSGIRSRSGNGSLVGLLSYSQFSQ